MKLDFDSMVARWGEVAVFYLMDNWERFIKTPREHLPIEDRWAIFIEETNDNANAFPSHQSAI